MRFVIVIFEAPLNGAAWGTLPFILERFVAEKDLVESGEFRFGRGMLDQIAYQIKGAKRRIHSVQNSRMGKEIKHRAVFNRPFQT